MKTIKQLENEVSQKYYKKDFKYVMDNFSINQIVGLMEEVAKLYAIECMNDLGKEITDGININLN